MHREGQRYWADPWHWAQAAIVAACRTNGVLPVDGPFGDFSDEAGFRAQALRSATLGMVGKWAIHPSQVALANEVFTPSEAAVAEAREILAAMDEAQARRPGGRGLQGAPRRHRLDPSGRGHRAAGRDDRRYLIGTTMSVSRSSGGTSEGSFR
jgi:malyl-CoA/(S)-citramalyl-CoA lyase